MCLFRFLRTEKQKSITVLLLWISSETSTHIEASADNPTVGLRRRTASCANRLHTCSHNRDAKS
jgi:hypothetical protein